MAGQYYDNCCDPQVYRTCETEFDYVDNGGMSNYEKMCYLQNLFETAIGDLDGIDARFDEKEDKVNLTNVRKLSEDGDFTDSWVGETKSQFEQKIQNWNFLGLWKGETKEEINQRITFGDFQGTWEGETKTELDARIQAIANLFVSGDFTGTWEGETKSSLDARIDASLTLYQDVIDTINSISGFVINIIDGGFLAGGAVPTRDLGSITDPVTDMIDCGFVIYPCNCTV